MRLSAPVVRASRIWPDLPPVHGAVQEIEALRYEPVDVGANEAAVVERLAGEVRFLDKPTVGYPSPSVPSLDGADFPIVPDEFVALARLRQLVVDSVDFHFFPRPK